MARTPKKPITPVNKARGEFSFNIGDKSVILVPEFEGIAKIEAATDLGIFGFVTRAVQKQMATDFVLLVDCLNEGDTVTRDEVYGYYKEAFRKGEDGVKFMLLPIYQHFLESFQDQATIIEDGSEAANDPN